MKFITWRPQLGIPLPDGTNLLCSSIYSYSSSCTCFPRPPSAPFDLNAKILPPTTSELPTQVNPPTYVNFLHFLPPLITTFKLSAAATVLISFSCILVSFLASKARSIQKNLSQFSSVIESQLKAA